MKGQTALICGLIAALIIAVFAVINVDGVEVNYLFGTAEWPLILVILGSVVMGAVITGSLGIIKVYRLQQELKHLKKSAAAENSAEKQTTSRPSTEKKSGERRQTGSHSTK
ncbi:LapA family protein [Salibacterium aidingense]|uniref:LapA family protein n=1 Tax=Salibacterium aidingense TaxID=384933 RepID=UPI003BDF8989